MKLKLLKGDRCIYRPSSSMDSSKGGPGLFRTDGDRHLAGSIVEILGGPYNTRSGRPFYQIRFITNGTMCGHITDDCLFPIKRISFTPWNKPCLR